MAEPPSAESDDACGTSQQWHGSAASPAWPLPSRTRFDAGIARPGYTAGERHEYEDGAAVLREKTAVLLQLLRRSALTVAYTGAGLSTAAGIDDYASGDADGSAGEAAAAEPPLGQPPRSPFVARPTLMHHVMARMVHPPASTEAGGGGGAAAAVAAAAPPLLHRWVQQNHDGLPQKAGAPQRTLNEIHGSWYDPSNPVIPMDGELRQDYFADLLRLEREATLVLALGTSLSGMNADRLVTQAAARRRQFEQDNLGGGNGDQMAADQEDAERRDAVPQGAVIAALQRTQYDGSCRLRIYCRLERLAEEIVTALGWEAAIDRGFLYRGPVLASDVRGAEGGGRQEEAAAEEVEDVFCDLPYEAETGRRCTGDVLQGIDAARRLTLDLREDAWVRLTSGPHAGDVGEVTGKQREGHYKIRFYHRLNAKAKMKMPFERVLGTWWVEAALRGDVELLPVVSCEAPASPTRV